MHLIIPKAMSHCGYRNLSGGGQQIIRSHEHKFKHGCNVDNRRKCDLSTTWTRYFPVDLDKYLYKYTRYY